METLSAPVSTIKATPFFPAATPSHLLRPSANPSSLPIPAFTNLSARARPQSHHHHQAKSVLRPSPSPPRHRPTPRRVHRAASTGYAAALLDVARCEGALAAAERDLRRLVRGVRPVLADPGLDEAAKGEVVRGVAEGGGFYRHVVALVRMLVGKGRVGLVEEVMEQFVRLCDELSGTRVVVVMSEEGKKMEEQRLRGIAQEVHKATGAPKVRVRHLHRVAV
ncbi:ATP synthase [Musa troglodytarum]|uniref:ATP synthase n=1 Tax=Musa troglodytarum TaxID=320322 RepID=A0A9E7ED39_9LILI|nr:ATP synthase [Musa troglodytarum]